MKLTYDISDTMALARALEKALGSREITLVHDQALDVLAELQGAQDWSALASALSPTAIRAQLTARERRHLRLNQDSKYGPEYEMRAQTGFGLRHSLGAGGCDYVRVVDPLGREIDYYTAKEWQEDPKAVMLQILNAVVRPEPQTGDEADSPLNSDAHTPSIAKHPLTIYVRTSCAVQEAKRPEWAKIVLDLKLYLTLIELHGILHRDKLAQVHRRGDPSWAIDHNNDLWREMDRGWLLVTDSDSFRFHARPRYGDYFVETRDVYLKTLYEAVRDSTQIESHEYLRRGDVMIYDDNPHNLLKTLLEDGETPQGFTSEAIGLDEELDSP